MVELDGEMIEVIGKVNRAVSGTSFKLVNFSVDSVYGTNDARIELKLVRELKR